MKAYMIDPAIKPQVDKLTRSIKADVADVDNIMMGFILDGTMVEIGNIQDPIQQALVNQDYREKGWIMVVVPESREEYVALANGLAKAGKPIRFGKGGRK